MGLCAAFLQRNGSTQISPLSQGDQKLVLHTEERVENASGPTLTRTLSSQFYYFPQVAPSSPHSETEKQDGVIVGAEEECAQH